MNTKKLGITLLVGILSATLVTSMLFTPRYIVASESDASEEWLNVVVKVLYEGATSTVDTILSNSFPTGWKYAKIALNPVFNVLRKKIPGFSEWLDTPAGQKPSKYAQNAARQAAMEVRRNTELQKLVKQGFDELIQGQKAIRADIAELNKGILDIKNSIKTMAEKQELAQADIKSILSSIKKQQMERGTIRPTDQLNADWLVGIWSPNCAEKRDVVVYMKVGPNRMKRFNYHDVPGLGEFDSNINRAKNYIKNVSTHEIGILNPKEVILTRLYDNSNHIHNEHISIIDENTFLIIASCHGIEGIKRCYFGEPVIQREFWYSDWTTSPYLGKWLEENEFRYRCPEGYQLDN